MCLSAHAQVCPAPGRSVSKQHPRVLRSYTAALPLAKTEPSSTYTAVDNSSSYSIFVPPVVDISNLLAGQHVTAQQTQQVQQECEATGFLAVTGHGISTHQLFDLFSTAKQLFDLPYDKKMQMTVNDMKAGRGYEISPEHKAYMQEHQQLQQHMQPAHSHHKSSPSNSNTCISNRNTSREPSALDGILSERFLCGPQLTPAQQQDPYYSSEMGQVFFPPDAWPTDLVPQLQPQMLQCYSQCEDIAAALMRLFAVSLGLEQHYFDPMLARHHSNMQVANYPSQLQDPGPQHLRKKAHIDSGTLTLLASEDWLPGSCWQAGEGGLQLLSTQQEWLEVQVPQGALLVNLGSLMTRWTNTRWNSTLHRVTNPPIHKQPNSRRLSMAFFHKPAYDALIEVLPTCYSSNAAEGSSTGSSSSSSPSPSTSSSSSSSSSNGWQLPSKPLYPPAVVNNLTRQGILHKFKHLPPAEASKAYHDYLAGLRPADRGQQVMRR